MSEPSPQHPAFLLIDRAAVLFCGVAAGIAIGAAFPPQPAVITVGTPAGQVAAAPPPQQLDAQGLPRAMPAAVDVPPGLARAAAQKRPFRIGVFGDSFGDGLWAALYNQLPRRKAFQVLHYSQQATGFTRYRQSNLEDRLADYLAQGPVDVAVISFGANDTQGIFVDGKIAPLLSPHWQAEITPRITRYVRALQAQGANVVWLGLPVMRDSGYNAQAQSLNAFHARLMAQLGVPFIDTRAAATDAFGRYASHLPAKDGVPWLVRAGDGIHMTTKGYGLLTVELAARLRAWGEAARAGKGVTSDLVPQSSVARAPAVDLPSDSSPHTAVRLAAEPVTLAAPATALPLNLLPASPEPAALNKA